MFLVQNEVSKPLLNSCGSCWGAETENFPCCSTCEEVKAAYQIKNWEFDESIVPQCKQNDIGKRNVSPFVCRV